MIFDTLTLNQKKAMKMLAQEGGSGLFAKELTDEHRTTKNNIAAALKQLFSRELIDKEGSRWFIPDRSFELWCRRQ